ncbi:hypothetical protein JZK55_07360 [Dissulfurispira thermophila]|uniref:Transporter n=1 Tax=Dissulfurispira thermophila TaxID=2715679 RepID=A0A7G1GZK4_9BACT|nr:DUF502 domain-containing protein [Dissulfurispira thermophila]BCB95814.1 hypothetical protein JZK55_07360 [Dissulfurispira thermophila]
MVESIHITFKRKFLAGLIVTIPAVITIFVLVGIFKFVDGILGPFFDFFLGEHIAGLGFISAVIIIFLIGIISTNVLGKKVLGVIEKIFLNIPVFKSIYTAIKQLVDAFSPENKSSFKKFVIVEYPRPGAYAFGFLTKECVVESHKKEIPLKAVYIPTNNLYLGEIVLLDDKSITYTDISIEEGIKIILSGGIAAPSKIPVTTGESGK